MRNNTIAAAAGLLLLGLAPRTTHAQHRPKVDVRQSATEASASLGVSAEVLAASDPLRPEPNPSIVWTVRYPAKGSGGPVVAFPEGL